MTIYCSYNVKNYVFATSSETWYGEPKAQQGFRWSWYLNIFICFYADDYISSRIPTEPLTSSWFKL